MRRRSLLVAFLAPPFFAFACGDDDAAPPPGGSGTNQAGAAGAGAGAAGSATGTDVCDTGSCLACTACINQETCKQPYQACFENNPGCTALSQCYLGCSSADCRDTCDAQADEPSRTAARAYLDCSLCGSCLTVCGKDPSCP